MIGSTKITEKNAFPAIGFVLGVFLGGVGAELAVGGALDSIGAAVITVMWWCFVGGGVGCLVGVGMSHAIGAHKTDAEQSSLPAGSAAAKPLGCDGPPIAPA